MEHEDDWSFGRFEKDGLPIAGLTYFKIQPLRLAPSGITNAVMTLMMFAVAAIPSGLLAFAILVGALAGFKLIIEQLMRDKRREQRKTYYREDYLKSDDWKRKRALVLKRDAYKCAFCGCRATQVHHKRYAPKNVGREPIEWLVAICEPCHRRKHGR